jgi:hypothetical protein
MRVRELVEYMSKNVNRTMKGEQILALAQKQLEVKKYLPINKKKELVDDIISKCIYFENNTFRIDSIDCYMYFTMLTINAYTNLEIDDVEDCFDVLSESGLMPIIIAALGQEYNDVQTFLNMKCDEILANNSLEVQLGRFFNDILDKVGNFNDTLIDSLNDLNINKDSIANLVNMFVQQ